MKFRSRLSFSENFAFWVVLSAAVGFGILLCVFFGVRATSNTSQASEGRLITVYDRGDQKTFLTDAKTLEGALTSAGITLDPNDTVEPSRDEELVAAEYRVNIYRARPVIVIDGSVRSKVMTPYQTAAQIAKHAGIPLYKEDLATLTQSTDFVGGGAGLLLKIDRAVTFTLDLYGRKNKTRTHSDTVRGMLEEKGIVLGKNGRVSVALDKPVTAGMEIRVWREGMQTITEDVAIGFATELIYDADRALGYRAIKEAGEKGVRSISYEVEIRQGQEISRVQIADIVSKEPKKQTVVVGIKGMGEGLTKNKGAIHFTDSKGVVHRETYYDLNMSRVMLACGQGGKYSVRVDGAKIDADGYVIIAANLNRYPRCSVVETSMGPGKVYDTGGFAAVHPDGFDLATDWTRADGI